MKAVSSRDIKRHFLPKKKVKKGTSDLSYLYVHSIFTLLLIKQIFEKNKSLRAASKSQTPLWPRITSVHVNIGEKNGKPSEVTIVHIQCIMLLPNITQTSFVKIHDFYEKLLTHSQVLDTMGKLKDINGYIKLIHDKLPTICAALV